MKSTIDINVIASSHHCLKLSYYYSVYYITLYYNAPFKWKILVYNAVIISQLVYGLNVQHLTDACFNRLDAFHTRGLRAILGIEHAYFSGVSKEDIFTIANAYLNELTDKLEGEQFTSIEECCKKAIIPISDIIKNRQRKYLGHLLRLSEKKMTQSVKSLLMQTLSSFRALPPSPQSKAQILDSVQ